MNINKNRLRELSKIRNSVRNRIADICYEANSGHVGSSLSALEILTTVRYAISSEDVFVLSKGHAAALLYCVLREFDDLNDEQLNSFYKDGTLLPAHPAPNSFEKIPFATGSLGHGLSLASGLAKAKKLKSNSGRVYCICSDGELNEGSSWEALLFSSQFNLNNLICLIDRNQIQGFGRTEDVIRLEPLKDKLISFGLEVLSCDGHSLENLLEIIESAQHKEKPLAVICNTTKGRGMLGNENSVSCHYLPLSKEQYLFLKEMREK